MPRRLIPPHAARTMRRRAMPDTCMITDRPDNERGTYDRVTGATTFPDPAILYEGPCRFEAEQASRVAPGQGGGRAAIDSTTLRVPDTVSGIKAGAIVTCTNPSNADLYQVEWEISRAPSTSEQATREYELARIQQFPTPGGA